MRPYALIAEFESEPRLPGSGWCGLARDANWPASVSASRNISILMWLITVLMTGIGLIPYVIGWIVMPDEPLLLTAPEGAQRVTNP
jgi:phage shock protein PspC (stress-responsive transcriptional regulator)